MAVRELIHRRVWRSAPPVRRIASPNVTAARVEARGPMPAPGLMIGGVRDPAEKAADDLADQVMRMPEPAALGGVCAECDGGQKKAQRQVADEEEPVRMKAAAARIAPGASSAPAPAAAKAAIGAMGAGRPLSRAERGFFEPRFGADFSRVRVHDDAAAARAARALDARAFTRGADIAFAAGQRPGVARLTAHELAHVVQNTDAMGRDVARRAPPPPPPAGPAPPPPARVVSPVWNVQGRAVVVVESGGQRLAFYQRSGGSTRPAGHAGPQLGEWAPFDGFKIRTDGQGHFVKAPYHSGFDPTHELHGFGNATNKQISAWLGGQQLQRPPERPWQEVQIELQRLGVAVSHPLPTRGAGAPPPPPPARPAPARAPGGGSTTAPEREEGRPGATTLPKGTPARTPGTGGAVAGGVLVTAAILGKFALQRWLQAHFAPSIRADARRLVIEAIEGSRGWFDFYVIGPRQTEIQKAWAAGLQVRLRVVVDTEWVNTNIGRVMTKAEVAHSATQLLFGSDTPFPYLRFQPKRGFWAELFNAPVRTLGWEEFEIPLEGTEAPARPEPE